MRRFILNGGLMRRFIDVVGGLMRRFILNGGLMRRFIGAIRIPMSRFIDAIPHPNEPLHRRDPASQ